MALLSSMKFKQQIMKMFACSLVLIICLCACDNEEDTICYAEDGNGNELIDNNGDSIPVPCP